MYPSLLLPPFEPTGEYLRNQLPTVGQLMPYDRDDRGYMYRIIRVRQRSGEGRGQGRTGQDGRREDWIP